jgi:hypothetical protein
MPLLQKAHTGEGGEVNGYFKVAKCWLCGKIYRIYYNEVRVDPTVCPDCEVKSQPTSNYTNGITIDKKSNKDSQGLPMTPEDIAIIRELAERMAKAGFEQRYGIYYWCHFNNDEWRVEEQTGLEYVPYSISINGSAVYRAPTFSEIWKKLPNRILEIQNNKHCNFTIEMKRYYIAYVDNVQKEILIEINKDKLIDQDAAGELWLWVKENGYDSQD